MPGLLVGGVACSLLSACAATGPNSIPALPAPLPYVATVPVHDPTHRILTEGNLTLLASGMRWTEPICIGCGYGKVQTGPSPVSARQANLGVRDPDQEAVFLPEIIWTAYPVSGCAQHFVQPAFVFPIIVPTILGQDLQSEVGRGILFDMMHPRAGFNPNPSTDTRPAMCWYSWVQLVYNFPKCQKVLWATGESWRTDWKQCSGQSACGPEEPSGNGCRRAPRTGLLACRAVGA